MSTSQPRRAVLLGSGIVFVAILAALSIHPSGASLGMPDGWIRAGSAPADFDMGTDQSVAYAGKASGYLKSKVAKPGGFGTLMQKCKAEEFHGKRVRMSAWVKSEKVMSWAGLWMRVDGPEASQPLAFDNMQSRPIKGTSGWSQHQVVLDVAPEAKDIAFGILLDGPGAVWLDEIKFEVVDQSVPTTDTGAGGKLAAEPQNLDFEK